MAKKKATARRKHEAAKKKAALEAEAHRKKQEIESAEAERRRQEMQAKVAKKKDSKRQPLPSKPLPPIIDIRVLVGEVEAGRYPSIKRYKDDHDDICYICKGRGNLVSCDFCCKAVHFPCLLQRFTVKEPEPEEHRIEVN